MCLEDEVTDHNYASCKELLCQQCQDYEAGYVDGKYKALFEVSTQTTDHPPGCGCDTCQEVVERLRQQGVIGSRNESAVGGLDAELALLLGIGLADGEVL